MPDLDFQNLGARGAQVGHGPGDDRDHRANGLRSTLPGDGWQSLRLGVARVASGLPQAERYEPYPGSVFDGRERSPRTWSPDGRALRTDGNVKDHFGPRFDAQVPPGGYAWWYVDALSDDGHHGLTLIAFIGSVFSPYYAWSQRRRETNAHTHCAMNVALTGRNGHRWAMTERDEASLARSAHTLTIGPSQLVWTGQSLVADIDEVTAPIPRRLRGRITLHPLAVTGTSVALDARGNHTWNPIAPLARVEVTLENPKLSWSGIAYLDSNWGSAPLSSAFKHWSWSRTIEQDRTRVLYDVEHKSGNTASLALEFDANGRAAAIAPPPVTVLPKTRWRVDRLTRADRPDTARVVATWEDGPFYARSLIETEFGGAPALAVHESLSLERFSRPIVQAMLPFRMPRRHHAPRS